MAESVNVYVVDVGQGQCTYVEVLDSTDNLINTLLFDCGSDKNSDETKTNLDWIASRIANDMSTPGQISCIFFSHSDKDHISLTAYLLDKIAETVTPSVSYVWYAGAHSNYKKYDFNILSYIVTKKYCTQSNLKTTSVNYTNYDYENKNKWNDFLWKTSNGKVVVYAIASNVLSNDPDWEDDDDVGVGKTAEVKNRVSMVCGLYYAGASYIICGDATNTTMAAMNRLFSAGTTIFNNNHMTTLPHHGSRATGFAVAASKSASFAAIGVVSTFAGLLKSDTITISAYEKHRHPSLQLMSYFIPTITSPILRDARLTQKNTHRITAYADINLGTNSGMTISHNVVYSFESQTNTFSTRYFDGWTTFSYNLGILNKAKKSEGVVSTTTVINGFACWGYKIITDGSFLLGGWANLSASLFTSPAESSVAKAGALAGKKVELEIDASQRQRNMPVQVRKKTTKKQRPILSKTRISNRIRKVA